MKMLIDALELIVESEGFNRVLGEIRNSIANSDAGIEENGFATDSWLAGLVASRGSSLGKLSQAVVALKAGQIDKEANPKEYRDAVRTKIAFETMYRYGMVKRDTDGRYTFPAPNGGPADKAKLSRLSQFRTFLSSGFNADKVAADPTKTFRNDAEDVHGDWVAKLSPERKKMLDAYSEMSSSTFTMLRSLFAVRGAGDVAAYRSRINSAKFSESNDLQILKKLGFVGDGNLMNRGMVTRFGEFLKDPDGTGADNAFARLLPHNKELTYFVFRNTADKALARNAAGKETEHLNDPDAPQLQDDMTPEQDRAINSRISDIEGGTQNSTRNDRARDRKNNFSDMMKNAFN